MSSFLENHRQSEELAAMAEACVRAGDLSKARALYFRSGKSEEAALGELAPSQARTFGIKAVSVASLYFKARSFEAASDLAARCLQSSVLPEFARRQLVEFLVWIEAQARLEGKGFLVGESLVGDGDETAHIEVVIGSKTGHVGAAFASALTNNNDGFTTLLAVVAPNLPCKPDTILFNKVAIKGARQAAQMFGPAQAAVARAVVESVTSGVIPKDLAEELCLLVGVFIHWGAADNQRIYQNNYAATLQSIALAMRGLPTATEVIDSARVSRGHLAGVLHDPWSDLGWHRDHDTP